VSYQPSQADVDRLIDQAVVQGFPRKVVDPTALAQIAEAIRSCCGLRPRQEAAA
jgi:hypothetical protein